MRVMGRQGSLPGGERQACPWWRTTEARIFVTCWLIYLLFLNPKLQSSMAYNILDLAISFGDTGNVALRHAQAYGWGDTAFREGRYFSSQPPGASLAVLPLYLLAKPLLPLADEAQVFRILHVLATALLAAPAAALVVVLVYRTLRVLTPDALLCRRTAWAYAFGTTNFVHATAFSKEVLGALLLSAALLLALRVGLEGRSSRAAMLAGGVLAGAGAATIYPLALPGGCLLAYLLARRGRRAAGWFVLGCGLALAPLGVYHRAAFGSPLSLSYLHLAHPTTFAFALPSWRVLGEILAGSTGGFFFYMPLMGLTLTGAVSGWRRVPDARPQIALMGGIVASGFLIYASHLTAHAAWNEAVASIGLRYLYQLTPAAILPIVWAGPRARDRWLAPLAAVSIGLNYLLAQAGAIPTRTWTLGYALKVFGTTLGAGLLFADTLPALVGVPTLHAAVVRGAAGMQDLWHPARYPDLAPLVGGQLLAKAFSLLCSAVAAAWLWRTYGAAYREDLAGKIPGTPSPAEGARVPLRDGP